MCAGRSFCASLGPTWRCSHVISLPGPHSSLPNRQGQACTCSDLHRCRSPAMRVFRPVPGGPCAAAADALTVVTYNLLADKYGSSGCVPPLREKGGSQKPAQKGWQQRLAAPAAPAPAPAPLRAPPPPRCGSSDDPSHSSPIFLPPSLAPGSTRTARRSGWTGRTAGRAWWRSCSHTTQTYSASRRWVPEGACRQGARSSASCRRAAAWRGCPAPMDG